MWAISNCSNGQWWQSRIFWLSAIQINVSMIPAINQDIANHLCSSMSVFLVNKLSVILTSSGSFSIIVELSGRFVGWGWLCHYLNPLNCWINKCSLVFQILIDLDRTYVMYRYSLDHLMCFWSLYITESSEKALNGLHRFKSSTVKNMADLK